MESSHSQDTNGGEERTSPKGETFDRDTLLDLVRSILRHPAVKDAAVAVVRDGLTEPAEVQMREGVRAGANEALARLSDRLGDGLMDDAQEANEAAVA